MPHQIDDSDGPSTLPVPELNPLLNPILGQNMGRWAEVYFTSPPEKREQAVLELLRELQGENAGSAAVASPSQTQEATSEPAFVRASGAPEVPPPQTFCHACGRENPASHRFCGMCGTPLAELAAEPDIAAAELNVENPIADRHEDSTGYDPGPPTREEMPSGRSEEAVYQPDVKTNDLSLFQTSRDVDDRNDQGDGIYDPPPTSGSYRVYFGIALAVVILAFAYIAWRSARATSQSSHVEPQAPPAVSTQPAAPVPAPTSVSTPDTTNATPPSDQQAPVPSNAERAVNDAETPLGQTTSATPPASSISSKNPPTEALATNGAEELAMAQRYLNGSDGQERNPSEAAKWLWKSMAKHNADATLLLADLYLKGDGVSKNCDQARVLLDSAALRGMKVAGERLRHLQAFGCE